MNKKIKNLGWVIIVLQFIIEIYAVVEYKTSGAYQVNYGLTGIMIFSYVACIYIFGIKDTILMNVVSAFFAFLFENTSVSFGIPFGHFEHFASGIRIGNIPIQVGLGYFLYAFAGWLFADLIIGNKKQDIISKIGRPLLGSFIASSMDLVTDGINGLVDGSYTYPNGGGFFGSPLSNSLGWIITIFLTLLVWELVIIPKNKKKENIVGTPSIMHLQNCILLAMMILAPLFGFFVVKDFSVTDPLGFSWQAHYAYEASTMIALLALVFAMLVGIGVWLRRKQENQ